MKYKVYYAKSMRDCDYVTFIPGQTHAFIREVKAKFLDDVFYQMQGEVWSPRGEARGLIQAAGVYHTSMSVGDVAVDAWGRVWMCSPIGWATVYLPTIAGRVHKVLDAIAAKSAIGRKLRWPQ